jgi:hypothetical protein
MSHREHGRAQRTQSGSRFPKSEAELSKLSLPLCPLWLKFPENELSLRYPAAVTYQHFGCGMPAVNAPDISFDKPSAKYR